MSDIIYKRTYFLGDSFEKTKERAIQKLGKYLRYPDLISFNDLDKSVTFSTERLIPTTSTNRPRVMLLYSNPHPYSVYQGMFLSPNTKGQKNSFWTVMKDAGWINFNEEIHNTKQLADKCLRADYQGLFELIFYCYYAFPTSYPEEIIKIFGKEYFKHVIEPEAMDEFIKTIQELNVAAVVKFNKEIFNLVSNYQVDLYINCLLEGELIQSHIKGIDQKIPIFLTFPTGWRYKKNFRQFRKESLDAIGIAIGNSLQAVEGIE